MNSAQMIAAVRHAAGLPDNHPDYTDARIRLEINDTLNTFFSQAVLESQSNLWLQYYVESTVASTSLYRIPDRALLGGLKRLECRRSSTSDFYELEQASPDEVGSWDTDTGAPRKYEILGDHVRIFPTPNSANYSLRYWFFIRPPALVQEQTAGRMVAINSTTGVLTVTAAPTNRATGSELAEGEFCDIVSSVGSHEIHVASAYIEAHTPGSTSYTISSGAYSSTSDFLRVTSANDYLRATSESDWPMLPQEFHRTLADATAAVILAGGIGAIEKAGGLSGKAGKDLERFRAMLQPRVRDSVRKIRPRYGAVRLARSAGRRGWPPEAPSG